MGCPSVDAKYQFLLPTPPRVRGCDEQGLLRWPHIQQLIDDNGNNWRKILTIIAKLTLEEGDDWRTYRDTELFKYVGIGFALDEMNKECDRTFIAGKSFFDACPIPLNAITIGDGPYASGFGAMIWCPYLDYRQFPNRLIEAIRNYNSISSKA